MKSKLSRLCLAAVLTALAIVLVMNIRIVLVPVVQFLEYDPADIPIFIATIILGPAYGVGMTVAVSIIQGLTVSASSEWIGIIMHILATGSAALTLGLITKRVKSNRRVITGLLVGSLFMIVSMFLWNLLFTPVFMNVNIKVVMGLMPFIMLFNFLKALVNTVISFLLYKATQTAFKKIYKTC
ncbi:MAG: ECF transporter S component [Clostridiales bacterium]|nr:ECF transporter S component [Clostridiales bacterium]